MKKKNDGKNLTDVWEVSLPSRGLIFSSPKDAIECIRAVMNSLGTAPYSYRSGKLYKDFEIDEIDGISMNIAFIEKTEGESPATDDRDLADEESTEKTLKEIGI